MGDNGNGNGNGRGGDYPQGPDVPWEEVRSLIWHFSLNHDLARCGTALRFNDGERFNTGYSEARLVVAIDLAKMLNRLGQEIGRHRAERFADFVAGIPPDRFGRVERIQLKADVRRMSELAVAGGYGRWISRDA
ncbi:MAG: hypothetical protein Q7N50_02530 [Armatimonadota bacterium]|nr:hypothetical protein [Armatimonadota bacterium]